MLNTQAIRPARKQDACNCKAYPFPHREGSGKCYTNEEGPFCGECGKPCKASAVDNGIGSYEFWGQKCTDTRIEIESECCDAPVFSNAALTVNYDPSDD